MLSAHNSCTKLALCIVLNQQDMTLDDKKYDNRPSFAIKSNMTADNAFTCHDTAMIILLLCCLTWLETSVSVMCIVPCTDLS